MTCQHTMTLGVYLLGALDPVERSEFESHLSGCEVCRGELIRLSPLPGLLNQISPEDFADSLPPTGAEMGATVLTRAPAITEPMPFQQPLPPVDFGDGPRARGNRPGTRRKDESRARSRRFWRVASAFVGVIVLAVAGIFGWRAIREDPTPPLTEGVVWSAISPDGTASVEARLVEHSWGTEILSTVDGLPPDRECYLLVFDHYGKSEVAGWWGTDHDPNEEIPGSTSFRRSKIERLEFRLDDKTTVVLTVEAPTR